MGTTLQEQLLRQADRLARSGRSRPVQANLRRAISSCYYALFHYLVDQSCCCMMGHDKDRLPYRCILARAFAHGDMKEACKHFMSATLTARMQLIVDKMGINLVIPPEIQTIAVTFVTMQEKRHSADYDQLERFKQTDVFSSVQLVHQAIRAFKPISRTSEARFFLSCLIAWRHLKLERPTLQAQPPSR